MEVPPNWFIDCGLPRVAANGSALLVRPKLFRPDWEDERKPEELPRLPVPKPLLPEPLLPKLLPLLPKPLLPMPLPKPWAPRGGASPTIEV